MAQLASIDNVVLRLVLISVVFLVISAFYYLFIRHDTSKTKVVFFSTQYIGISLNATVVLANGGKMPALNFPYFERHLIPMTDSTIYNFLGDRFFSWGMSVGDLLLFGGLLILVCFPLLSVFRKLR